MCFFLNKNYNHIERERERTVLLFFCGFNISDSSVMSNLTGILVYIIGRFVANCT